MPFLARILPLQKVVWQARKYSRIVRTVAQSKIQVPAAFSQVRRSHGKPGTSGLSGTCQLWARALEPDTTGFQSQLYPAMTARTSTSFVISLWSLVFKEIKQGCINLLGATITKYQRTGGSNRNLFSQNPGGQKSWDRRVRTVGLFWGPLSLACGQLPSSCVFQVSVSKSSSCKDTTVLVVHEGPPSRPPLT